MTRFRTLIAEATFPEQPSADTTLAGNSWLEVLHTAAARLGAIESTYCDLTSGETRLRVLRAADGTIKVEPHRRPPGILAKWQKAANEGQIRT